MTIEYTSLGLMSGTSGDGVDASIIKSDGENQYSLVLDKYFQYDKDIYKNIHKIKDNINTYQDLKKLSKETRELEEKITLFHAEVVKSLAKDDVDFVSFFVDYNGSTNTVASSYKVYVTKNGNFRQGVVGI